MKKKIDANVDVFLFHFNFRLLRERKSDRDGSGQVSPFCPDSCVQEIWLQGQVLSGQEFGGATLGKGS